MKIKNLNDFFGNLLIIVGVAKEIMIFFVLIGTIGMISGTSNANIDIYTNLKNILVLAELTVAIASVVMLIKNNKKETGVTTGYKYAIIALLIEILNIFPIIGILIAIAVGMQYIKAGVRVKSDNDKYYPPKVDKEMLERSDWFYSEHNGKIEKELLRLKQKKEKIDEEILAWENLLTTREITEEIFVQETQKLREKSKNLETQINRYNLLNK